MALALFLSGQSSKMSILKENIWIGCLLKVLMASVFKEENRQTENLLQCNLFFIFRKRV